MMTGAVPITEALQVIKDLVGNRVYEEILDKAIRDVEEGNTLADSLMTNNNYIPLSVSQMISIGEETGKLEKVSAKLADFYQREVEASIRNLAVLIEPMIMIVLAVVVAVFVLAVITPMWQLSSSI